MKPGETSYKDLTAAMQSTIDQLRQRYVVQRFQFISHFRRPGESVSIYVAALQALAEFCNFGETLELMLCDRLVCGMNNETTQRLLLAENKLTYKKAPEIATSQETASKNVQALRGLHSVHSQIRIFSLIRASTYAEVW